MADGREAELIGSQRSRVVWVGRRIPKELQDAAGFLGLTVEEVRYVQRIDVTAADLFAVIISAVGDDLDKALARLLRLSKTMHVLDYGVLLGTASPNQATANILRRLLLDKSPNADEDVAALSISCDDFARAFREHPLGPSANPSLQLPLPGHTETENYDHYDYESDAILLQRAFYGYTNLELEAQPGGHSRDCKVWKVDAHRNSQPCEPFVAKAARRGDLEKEFSTYCAFVRDSVPFPFRAPVIEAQFVKGATRAVLVSAFVSRALRLDDYLAATSSPQLVMVSLFEGAIGTWRREAHTVKASLGHFYIEQQKEAAKSSKNPTDAMAKSLLPDPESLTAAFQKGRKVDSLLPTPSQLWEQLNKLPIKDYLECRIHGDLNIRNVFVRWNAIDTVLIDFSHSGIQESMARDPSKLDTSISLTAQDKEGNLVADDMLRQLYQPPLLPPRNFEPIDGRTEAIRQIRRHAGGEGISSYEYEILTLCHLLRFACEPDDKTRDTERMQNRRVLSYILACGLVKNLSKAASP